MDKIFVGVDPQIDFIDGALGTKEARDTIEKFADTMEYLRAAGFQLHLTRDTHNLINYEDTIEGQLVPLHTVIATTGWNFHESLKLVGTEQIHGKSTFGSYHLVRSIVANDEEPQVIIMAGYCTDICGITNALMLRAALRYTPIIWLSYCSAGTTPEMAKKAEDIMARNNIFVLSSFEALKDFKF